jgi:hypothetical protein
MSLVRFEPTTPAFERAKTVRALGSVTTVIGGEAEILGGNPPQCHSYDLGSKPEPPQ